MVKKQTSKDEMVNFKNPMDDVEDGLAKVDAGLKKADAALTKAEGKIDDAKERAEKAKEKADKNLGKLSKAAALVDVDVPGSTDGVVTAAGFDTSGVQDGLMEVDADVQDALDGECNCRQFHSYWITLRRATVDLHDFVGNAQDKLKLAQVLTISSFHPIVLGCGPYWLLLTWAAGLKLARRSWPATPAR